MKIAMFFPGYGSQFVGMGKELYDEYRIVQEYFEEASNCLGSNFVKLCFASSDIELGRISNAYPALFLVTSAICALLEQKGIRPSVVAGYNDGEYAALFSGGCFSFPDGLYLLSKYATFYQEALEHMDIEVIQVVGVSTEKLEAICLKASLHNSKAFIAIYNGPTDHAVAGDTKAVGHVRRLAGELKNSLIDQLGVEVGLHSELMDPVVEQFRVYLEKVDFKNLLIPMISSFDGTLISQSEAIKGRVLQHINSPLVFTRVIDTLADYDLIVELGPSTRLDTLVKNQYPEKQTIAIQTCADIANLEKIISKI